MSPIAEQASSRLRGIYPQAQSSAISKQKTDCVEFLEGFKILNHSKNPFLKKNICILLQKQILHVGKWGVVLYTQSFNFKEFKFYSHFKIFPMISYFAACFDGHNLMPYFTFQPRLSFLYLQPRVFLSIIMRISLIKSVTQCL